MLILKTPPLHFLPASLTPPHSSDISGCRGTKAMSVMSASIHSPCLPSPSQTANLSHCTEAQLQLKLVCCHMCVRRCKSLQKVGESGSTPVVQLQLHQTVGNRYFEVFSHQNATCALRSKIWTGVVFCKAEQRAVVSEFTHLELAAVAATECQLFLSGDDSCGWRCAPLVVKRHPFKPRVEGQNIGGVSHKFFSSGQD